jgi:hypothetical protein
MGGTEPTCISMLGSMLNLDFVLVLSKWLLKPVTSSIVVGSKMGYDKIDRWRLQDPFPKW